jgi:signal transduction histidine kinase
MRERAKALGGDLDLTTAPGEGTVVTLALDAPADSEGAERD